VAGETMKKGINEFITRWRETSRTRKIVIGVITAAVFIFLLLMLQHFSKTQYVTLYSNLDVTQASPLVQELKGMGVPYKIDDFGSTIKVPQEMVDELRIDMAGKGVLFAQGLGFELFDEEKLGMTDFERQIKLQRALQEELRRTISSLEAVLQARVHLVLPEPRVFMQEMASPSAAIYLQLNPFVPLKQEQVKGIVNLVASSVENLEAENITIIDSQGNILYDAVTEEDTFKDQTNFVMEQLEIKRDFENKLERRLQAMLEKVFGQGKALSLVTAEMDFDSRETTIVEYSEQVIPRSTHITEERFEGEGNVMSEVGEANYPGYVGSVPGGESSYDRREEIMNNEVGERNERVITAPGKVLRLHASVIVDSSQGAITQRQVEQINNIVSTAIGFDPERGDQLSVEGLDFDNTLENEIRASIAEMEARQHQEKLRQQIILGSIILLSFITLLVVLLRRRRQRLLDEGGPLVEEAGIPLEELITLEGKQEEDILPVLPEDTAQERVRLLVEKHPDVAVSILRSWLVEK
jgi:flagellar M-ring protein FliF